MKKKMMLLAMVFVFCMAVTAGCGRQAEDPGTPPEEVIHPSQDAGVSDEVQDGSQESADTGSKESMGEDTQKPYDGNVLNAAVTVRIGRDGSTDYDVDMYNNAAVDTMLGYLSNSALLFPTYTYDGETGYVGQHVRGTYTRDDEIEVVDIHTGELYLFGDGQLRLYFKDVEGANILATPVGCVADTATLTDAVESAYESNLDDTWGVDVYFWITKN